MFDAVIIVGIAVVVAMLAVVVGVVPTVPLWLSLLRSFRSIQVDKVLVRFIVGGHNGMSGVPELAQTMVPLLHDKLEPNVGKGNNLGVV